MSVPARPRPLFADIDMFLRPLGFMFHRFYPAVSRTVRPLLVDGSIYAGLSQLVWADALFIRDLTRLDLLSDDRLLGMATILHECYASLDIALHLLAEYDRRCATGFAAAYLAGLRPAAVGDVPAAA